MKPLRRRLKVKDLRGEHLRFEILSFSEKEAPTTYYITVERRTRRIFCSCPDYINRHSGGKAVIDVRGSHCKHAAKAVRYIFRNNVLPRLPGTTSGPVKQPVVVVVNVHDYARGENLIAPEGHAIRQRVAELLRQKDVDKVVLEFGKAPKVSDLFSRIVFGGLTQDFGGKDHLLGHLVVRNASDQDRKKFKWHVKLAESNLQQVAR